MRLTFEKQDASSLALGAYTVLRFHGPELRDPGNGALIARREQDHWTVRGQRYRRLDCTGPVTVTFYDAAGNPSRKFGPYAHFSSVDGIGFRDHEVFCHLDDGDLWYVRPVHCYWPVLELSDA